MSVPATTIDVLLNGESRQVPSGLTVETLLDHLGLDPARVAVELNRHIVRKNTWAASPIEAGAQVEIVMFVGGG